MKYDLASYTMTTKTNAKARAPTCITVTYAMYYVVMLVAAIIETNLPGNRWSPALFLLILGLHFAYGAFELFTADTTENGGTRKGWLSDRYCAAKWESVVAATTDLLLGAAVVVGIIWMHAATQSQNTLNLFAVTSLLAAFGNLGCVVLRVNNVVLGG